MASGSPTNPKDKAPANRLGRRIAIGFAAIAAALVLLALALLSWEERNFQAPGSAAGVTVLIVPQGAGLTTIANDLERAGIVESARLFRLGVVRRGAASALKAGEYEFPTHASMKDVLDVLVGGKSILHRVTAPEGLTSEMIVEALGADPTLTGDVAELPAEGSLLPETYLFTRGTTRAELIARMAKAQADLVAALWPQRKPDLPYLTAQDAIVLASIVEKETSIASERPRIAAVFVNRLKRGMKLQSDPTIIYGLTKGRPLGRGLRASEIAKPNPYSTYQIDGLPPTPICNPGRAAIEAVLNPPDSDELYFVADGTGGHAFAGTPAEHARNVARWRGIERNGQ